MASARCVDLSELVSPTKVGIIKSRWQVLVNSTLVCNVSKQTTTVSDVSSGGPTEIASSGPGKGSVSPAGQTGWEEVTPPVRPHLSLASNRRCRSRLHPCTAPCARGCALGILPCPSLPFAWAKLQETWKEPRFCNLRGRSYLSCLYYFHSRKAGRETGAEVKFRSVGLPEVRKGEGT